MSPPLNDPQPNNKPVPVSEVRRRFSEARRNALRTQGPMTAEIVRRNQATMKDVSSQGYAGLRPSPRLNGAVRARAHQIEVDDLRRGFAEARTQALQQQGLPTYEKVRQNQLSMHGFPRTEPPPRQDGIAALRKFAADSGLIIDSAAVAPLLKACPMRGGTGHRLAYLPEKGRVLKDADLSAVPAKSAYDYLTDTQLANHYFGGDVQIVGFYQQGQRLHMLTIQSYVDGLHPGWGELKAGLCAQGIFDPCPLLEAGSFVIGDPGEEHGEIRVGLLNPDNAVIDAGGWVHPISARFYFRNHKARTAALQRLGLDRIRCGSREPDAGRSAVLDIGNLDWATEG